jgi:bifunctional NMN adenylyltransferase/nudix hydrolase
MDYPTSFQTTDAFIFNRVTRGMLLGRKKGADKWRFIGGFVDPKDVSLEAAAQRERIEEAGKNLECAFPEYIFSFRVDDPRYKDSPHKILTAVFAHEYIFGYAQAGDDIEQVDWFDFSYIRGSYKKIVVKTHWPIVESLIKHGLI